MVWGNDAFVIESNGQLGVNVTAKNPSNTRDIPKVLNALSSFWAVVWTKRHASMNSSWTVSKGALP